MKQTTIKLPDDFEPGQCDECPFSYEDWEMDELGSYFCVFHYRYSDCKLEVKGAEMKIGDEVYIHGYVDEIRKYGVIIRNKGGYFGTSHDEIVSGELRTKQDVDDAESRFMSVIEDIKEELSHIDKPEPHNIGYESGVYDGVQLAIRTIDKHISGKER